MSTTNKRTMKTSKSVIGAIIENGITKDLNLNSPHGNTTNITNINYYPQGKLATPVFEIPPLIETFRGRSDKLDELKFKLIENKIVVITGHAGIGKTELAKQFAHNMLKRGLVKQVLWFEAKHMTYNKKMVKEIFKKINHKCLCVYDNCVEIMKVKQFMPPVNSNFYILLTSQEKIPDYEEVTLDTLSMNAALDVIKAILTTDYKEKQEPQYKKLAKCVSCVPLVLQVVAGYFKFLIIGGMDASKISKFIEEDFTNINIYTQLCNPYDKTIYFAIKDSVERMFAANHVLPKIKILTKYVLCVFTYLNPNQIQQFFLLNIINQIPNFTCTESDIQSSLHYISNYYLINLVNKKAKLHKLMQDSLKHYFEEEQNQDINKTCYFAIILWLSKDQPTCYYSYHSKYVMKYADRNEEIVINFIKKYSNTNSVLVILKLLVQNKCTKCITAVEKYYGNNIRHIINDYELL